MVEHKTDSGHTIGKEFPTQMEITENTTKIIRGINACSDITPEEKKKAIANLKGITREQMIAITEQTSNADSNEAVRALINAESS